MPLVSSRIRSFIHGVSQQDDVLKLAGHTRGLTNALPSEVRGNQKRPPLEFVPPGPVSTSIFGQAKWHLFKRDENTRYIVGMVGDGRLTSGGSSAGNGPVVVVDVDTGIAQFPTSQTHDGLPVGGTDFTEDYLSRVSTLDGEPDARKRLRAISVGDTTFMVNKDVTVGRFGAVTGQTPTTILGNADCLIYVKQGFIDHEYRVEFDPDVGGTVFATYTPGTALNAATNNIATQLTALINSIADWNATAYGSVIHVWNTAVGSSEFSLKASDGFGGQALIGIKNSIERLSDLPPAAPNGYAVEVQGTDLEQYNNYWVNFVADDKQVADTPTTGTWKETVAPGLKVSPQWYQMPHLLIHDAATGTFTMRPTEWEFREVGDEDSAPDPSFIHQNDLSSVFGLRNAFTYDTNLRIRDAVFHKNRIGFMSDENISFTRTGSFFEFWPKTATTILDSDPVDVAASAESVVNLQGAVQFNRDLLLFSDNAQFVMSGETPLTPEGAVIDTLSAHEQSTDVPPVSTGQTAIFPFRRGQSSGFREILLDGQTGVETSLDITSHIPTYIPSDIHHTVSNPATGLMAVLSDDEPDTVYVYKFVYNGLEKVLTSWSKWQLPGVSAVMTCFFIDNYLYFLLDRGDGIASYERMDLETTERTYAGLDFVPRLDRLQTSLGQATVAGRTRFTIDTTGGLSTTDYVVVAPGGTPGAGHALGIVDSGPTWVEVNGEEYIGSRAPYGLPYEWRAKLSTTFIRDREDRPVTEGRFQLRRMRLNLSETGYMRAEVTPANRPTRTIEWTPETVSLLDSAIVERGRFNIPVLGENIQTDVDLVNDTHYPSTLISADVEGFYHRRNRST